MQTEFLAGTTRKLSYSAVRHSQSQQPLLLRTSLVCQVLTTYIRETAARYAPDLSDDMGVQKRAAVVILPTEALPQGELQKPGVEQTLALTPIEFPENAKASSVVPLYILRKEEKTVVLVELVRFKSPFASWFFVPEAEELVPDVCSNGDVTMVTRVDPLFCALVLMDSLREVGDKQVFQPLDALCVTADGTNLTGLCDTRQFEMLCDVKEAGGESFYKLNDEKAMSWLQAKHGALVRESKMKSADAVGIISQYVTAHWGKQLRKQLLAEVENVDSEAHKAAKNSHSLALATMMEDAVETNQAILAEERDRKKGSDKWSVKKPVAKSKAAKKKKEKAPEASFWTAREKSLAKKRNLKRKKTSPK
ncbi:unnamed protein product [Chondrus crispus]|uniref:Ribonuclease H2 subunit B wHTH domain-containing protein n=1 Tax=Chondrus crispus TaxID=2769 RepID=R7QL60_CHOCR|nr:unnamed protein product [Chondrus crispus]CDF38819.1 unnamed protein product [Chondrus crispus]|eukprot:XP_005718724.1 unnamed protein product [Chondrus crispus]